MSQPGVPVNKRPARRSSKKDAEKIVTHDWTVAEIIAQYPQTTEVMAEYGLHCFGCAANAIESIEEGCKGHGFSNEDIENLLEDINDAIAHAPPRPQVLHITEDAAHSIANIAKKEGVSEEGLSVQAHEDGSFFMEFRKRSEEGEKEFFHAAVPDVRIFASLLTLQRIGGSTIDFKDGKFTLEMGGCCTDGECGCQQSIGAVSF